MRGIILAGGTGSRLFPATSAISKQLLPVFDKPMIYYPLTTLITIGIQRILVITTAEGYPCFRRLLGDGSQLGLYIEYAIQERPEGIAHCLIVARDFIERDTVALILGDNIFHGPSLADLLPTDMTVCGARIFAYRVSSPSSYGVVNFDSVGRIESVEEKPRNPTSHYAVTGLYFYDSDVGDFVRKISPSARGELEITSLNAAYLAERRLHATRLAQDVTWFDAGTFSSLAQATDFVRATEQERGVKIGCIEEAAWRAGVIDDTRLLELAEPLLASGYGDYLRNLVLAGSGATDVHKSAVVDSRPAKSLLNAAGRVGQLVKELQALRTRHVAECIALRATAQAVREVADRHAILPRSGYPSTGI
jgi:glucose-1-phosphate thymidylyltransferase